MADDIIRHRTNTPEFEDNFEAVFGAPKKVERGSYVWDSKLGKLVERGQRQDTGTDAPSVLTMEEFKSPIDGSMISDHGQLRAHNARHGVTNIQDYGDNGGKAYFERAEAKRTENINGSSYEAKMERRHELRQALRRGDIK